MAGRVVLERRVRELEESVRYWQTAARHESRRAEHWEQACRRAFRFTVGDVARPPAEQEQP